MIVIVIPSFRLGGAERVTVTLANALHRRSVPLRLVAMDASGPLRSEVSQGIEVVDLGARRALTALPAFREILASPGVDVVISHLTHLNLMTLRALALSKSRARVILVEHNTISRASSESSLRRDAVYARAARFEYRRADQLAAVAKHCATELDAWCRLPPGTTRVLYNPIDAATVRAMSRDRIDVPGGPLIVAAGRLVPQKDFATLIRAFSALPPAAHLVILGEGADRGMLSSLAAELNVSGRVHLPGVVSNPYPWMRAARLVVSTSRFEGMPTVLIESLILGTRVVATDVPGTSEVVSSPDLGTLAPVGDWRAISRAMEVELSRPEQPDASELIERHSPSRIVDRYLRVIEEARA